MKESTRNIAVGLTVLVALVLLAGLILLFTGLPWFLQGGYAITIAADTTYDAHPGDGVHLLGMQIGRVTDVRFTDPAHPYKGITISARIDEGVKLPGNVTAEFFTKGLVGAAYIELKATGPVRIDPSTGRALEFFPTDGSMVMTSRQIGTGVLPQELLDAMKSLTDLAQNINKLLASPPAQAGGELTTGPSAASTQPVGLQGTVEKLNRTLDAISAVLGDAENQANLKVSLANLARATEAATETMNELKKFASQAGATAEDFSKLAAKAVQSAEEVSRLMEAANRIATKMEQGEGTAGMLLSDPQLYNSFLQATRQMNDFLAELQTLVELWKKEGVKINVK